MHDEIAGLILTFVFVALGMAAMWRVIFAGVPT
jgi:hypothetical protein